MVLKKPHNHSEYRIPFGVTVGGFLVLVTSQLCFVERALASTQNGELPPEQTLGTQIRSKLRLRNFTEFMSPALKGGSGSIPNSDGSGYIPTTLFNIFTADFEIAPNYRILYYQRVFLLLAADATFQGMSIFGRDPRFALRRTQVFALPNLNSTLDLYFQPGISNNQLSGGNGLEVGFRVNLNYAPAGTRWTFGIVQEFTSAYLDPAGKGMRAYGWFMPWLSYDLSEKFSLQHFTNLAFKNPRNLAWNQFQWDDQPPFIQNGANFNLTDSVSLSLFLNNYLGVAPTLVNTWASLWLSVDFL
jgi:hypothetical protein